MSSKAPEFDAFGEMKRPSRLHCCNFTIRRVVDISDKLCKYWELSRKHAQSSLKTTLPKSWSIRIFKHFRSIVDDSTPCFLVAMDFILNSVQKCELRRSPPSNTKEIVASVSQSLHHNCLINSRSFCVSASWGLVKCHDRRRGKESLPASKKKKKKKKNGTKVPDLQCQKHHCTKFEPCMPF